MNRILNAKGGGAGGGGKGSGGKPTTGTVRKGGRGK